VNDRLRVTPWAAFTGPKGDVRLGDVCPEPATIGIRLRHLGRRSKAFLIAVPGAQTGRQAFALEREVPT
jgi:hypothetical protein